jgi:hypothetical protein
MKCHPHETDDDPDTASPVISVVNDVLGGMTL